MTEHTYSDELPRLHTVQQRISVVTWIVVCLLSVRGLFAFYGMKEKGWFEQAINFLTDPLVQVFSFSSLEASNIPGISVGIAAISLLIVSYIAQLVVHMYHRRAMKTYHAVSFRHTLAPK